MTEFNDLLSDIRESKRFMTLDEAIARDSAGYNNPNHVNAKFRVLDHVFNTIGNGIDNVVEFFEQYSLHHGELVAPLAESDAEQRPFNPYPNFKKSYSLVWSEGCIGELPTDWIEGAIWFYNECRTYFQNGAVGHWGSYNGTVSPVWGKAIARYKTPDITDEEFFAAVTKAYNVEFNGDLPDFLSRRWEIQKTTCMSFIEETLEFLQKELDSRK